MEMIEDVEVDVDTRDNDPPVPVMTLTLIGDFVSTFEEYLGNDDMTDPEFGKVRFDVPRSVAEKLVQQISPYLMD